MKNKIKRRVKLSRKKKNKEGNLLLAGAGNYSLGPEALLLLQH